MKFDLKQWLLSAGVFGVVIFGLVSVDERVRERFDDFVTNASLSQWGDRALQLGEAIVSAIRHQSLENATLMLFAAVGVLLFLFMVRT